MLIPTFFGIYSDIPEKCNFDLILKFYFEFESIQYKSHLLTFGWFILWYIELINFYACADIIWDFCLGLLLIHYNDWYVSLISAATLISSSSLLCNYSLLRFSVQNVSNGDWCRHRKKYILTNHHKNFSLNIIKTGMFYDRRCTTTSYWTFN